MAVTLTPVVKYLPDGIPEDIGETFVGPWADDLGGDGLEIATAGGEVVDYQSAGIKSVSFASGGGLDVTFAANLPQPSAVAVVIDDWTVGAIFDGLSSTERQLLYQQSSSPRSSIWSGTGYFSPAGYGARSGNPHVVICFFNGDNSFHMIDGERYDGEVGTQLLAGLTVGHQFNASQQSDATVAAIIAGSVSLGGETHRATIAQALLEAFSEDLYSIFDGVAAPVTDPADLPVDVARGFPTEHRVGLLLPEDAEAEGAEPGVVWRLRNSDNAFQGMGNNITLRPEISTDNGAPALLFDGGGERLYQASSSNAGTFGTDMPTLEPPCSIHLAIRLPEIATVDVTSATSNRRNVLMKLGGSAKSFALEQGGCGETRSKDGDYSNRILFIPATTLDDRMGELVVLTWRLTEPDGGESEVRGYVDGVDVTPETAPTTTILTSYVWNAMDSGGNGGEVSSNFFGAIYCQGDQSDSARSATVEALMELQGRSVGGGMTKKNLVLGNL